MSEIQRYAFHFDFSYKLKWQLNHNFSCTFSLYAADEKWIYECSNENCEVEVSENNILMLETSLFIQFIQYGDIPAELDEWVRKCGTKILHGNHWLLGLAYFFIGEKSCNAFLRCDVGSLEKFTTAQETYQGFVQKSVDFFVKCFPGHHYRSSEFNFSVFQLLSFRVCI